jgi:hypothetical protein
MQMFEAVMPNITGMWERSSYQLQWARAAKETGSDLAYGTPEFSEALEAAGEKIPNFDEIIYRDRQGRALPLQEQIYRKYVLLARQLSKSAKPATARVESRKQETGDRLAEFIKAENSRSSF